MSVSSDVALKKIGSIIRDIEENKNAEIESIQLANEGLSKDLSECKTRLEEAKSELARVAGLFGDQRKQFTEAVERAASELKDRDQHVARLLRVTDELQGEIDVLKDGYATLRSNSARAATEASESAETARKAFEEALDNLKGENLALSAKLRGKQPAEEATRALAKEAAEALRERTFQTWDRKKYLGLLDRLDEASGTP